MRISLAPVPAAAQGLDGERVINPAGELVDRRKIPEEASPRPKVM
jgi:hypothetical protein